jgi:hypothetical protein
MIWASDAWNGSSRSTLTTRVPVTGPVGGGDTMLPDKVMTVPLPTAVTLPGRLDACLFTDSKPPAAACATVIVPRLVAAVAGAAG